MPVEKKFTRVEPDDPNRCQAVHASMQCPFRAVGDFDTQNQKWDGPKYCPRHGGASQRHDEIVKEKRMYFAAQWKDRIKAQSDHPKIKTLGEEVGIIRMLLEAKLNSLKDDKELIMAASGIVSLTNSVKDLLKTWQHIEERSGQVLDRARLTVFISELLEILTRYISDPEILQMVGEDINESLDGLLTSDRK